MMLVINDDEDNGGGGSGSGKSTPYARIQNCMYVQIRTHCVVYMYGNGNAYI